MFRERYGIKGGLHVRLTLAGGGHCQGMKQVVAVLLMFLSEEDTFWALVQLMTDEKHATHVFFIPGFPKLLRFQAYHEHVLGSVLPQWKQHLDKEQVSTGIYTTKWFLQCFIDQTPFLLTLKLWDTYILWGKRVLTAMAYTVLEVHKRKLDAQGPPEDKVTVSTVTLRPREASDARCFFMLAFLEDGAPLAQHKSLTWKGLAWPAFGPQEGRAP
ncbi:hypothetical protein EI555_006156 [Monodon monoceros]|uniref:Rab-GAP TBC domain-containing protein n=1 Tax=Monodon monoceros TaxID=40151 RepID=A0A4U1ELI1_MONMO|nr:hypothetical protein EI555_006156 [Monodon monoceros]